MKTTKEQFIEEILYLSHNNHVNEQSCNHIFDKYFKESQTGEKIICAALKLDNGEVFYGHRHPHCIEAANGKLSWTMNRQEMSKVEKVQGFITSTGRFVDRKEGLKIALENNQVLNEKEIRGDRLHTEDLY